MMNKVFDKPTYLSVPSLEQHSFEFSAVVNKQGQRTMKTAIKSFMPLVHFSNKAQKLGIILENKGFQNLKLLKNVRNKKCPPKLIF